MTSFNCHGTWHHNSPLARGLLYYCCCHLVYSCSKSPMEGMWQQIHRPMVTNKKWLSKFMCYLHLLSSFLWDLCSSIYPSSRLNLRNTLLPGLCTVVLWDTHMHWWSAKNTQEPIKNGSTFSADFMLPTAFCFTVVLHSQQQYFCFCCHVISNTAYSLCSPAAWH